jgi:hypothetical protein
VQTALGGGGLILYQIDQICKHKSKRTHLKSDTGSNQATGIFDEFRSVDREKIFRYFFGCRNFDYPEQIGYHEGMSPESGRILNTVINSCYIAIIICIAGLSLSTGTGCAELQGRSVKTYNSDYRVAVQASADALQNLEMPVLKEVSDELKTDFLARRPNGTPVTVEVRRIDQNFTQVSVATGAGVDRFLDREVSNQIHGFIRKKLGKITVEN